MQITTEKLSNLIQAGSSSMSSVANQILDNFKSSKEYRHAFVEEKVRTQLAVQIKAIREQRNMGRPEFATLMDKAPSWVFRLEDPNQPPPTISTLLKVAESFDVDLEIRFRRFSGLLNQIEHMTPESFEVPSFEEEVSRGVFDRNAIDEGVEWRVGLENLMTLYNLVNRESSPLEKLLMRSPEPQPPSPATAISRYEQTGAIEVPPLDRFGDKQTTETTDKYHNNFRRERPEKTRQRLRLAA